MLGCCCKSKIIASNPSMHAILSLYPLPTLNQIMNILIYEPFQDLKVYKVNTSQQNSSMYRDSCCLFLRFCHCLICKKGSLWPMVLLPPPIIAPSSSAPSAKTRELIASYRDLGHSPEMANHPLRPVNHRICIYWVKLIHKHSLEAKVEIQWFQRF